MENSFLFEADAHPGVTMTAGGGRGLPMTQLDYSCSLYFTRSNSCI